MSRWRLSPGCAASPTRPPSNCAISTPSPSPETPAPAEDDEPAPELVLQKADAHALAATVAKEVARSLVPRPVLIVLVLAVAALVAWLVLK